MTRSTAREIALQLGFSVVMTDDFAENILDDFFDKEHYPTLSGESGLFSEYPDDRQMAYIRRLVQLVYDHRVELDHYIEQYAHGWRVERISKTAGAILRGAMCEILYMDDIPDAAAINEAVELAKKYEEPDTVAFINGVLGGFIRSEKGQIPPETDSSAADGATPAEEATPAAETDAATPADDTAPAEEAAPSPETDKAE